MEEYLPSRQDIYTSILEDIVRPSLLLLQKYHSDGADFDIGLVRGDDTKVRRRVEGRKT
jgi:hypothetical protein